MCRESANKYIFICEAVHLFYEKPGKEGYFFNFENPRVSISIYIALNWLRRKLDLQMILEEKWHNDRLFSDIVQFKTDFENYMVQKRNKIQSWGGLGGQI
jgi:hypothetical protein